jgi:hypothetical protein
MVAKGHNYGFCQKCGVEHKHPKGMLDKHHTPETRAKMSKPGKGKGIRHFFHSPEIRAKFVEARKWFMKNKLTPELRYKYGSGARGKPSHRKGKIMSLQYCLNIRQGMKESKIFKARVHEYHESKVENFLRRLYSIPEDVIFYPASKREHRFARTVLIEGRDSFGFITCSGLREKQESEQNDEGESDIPVVV